MSLVLSIPAEIAAQLVGKWLKVPDICKLEIALCSEANRLNLMSIYESTVIDCGSDQYKKDVLENQLDWMIVRKIAMSSLHILHPLKHSAIEKLESVLSSSKSLVKTFIVNGDSEALDSLIVLMAQHCKSLTHFKIGPCNLGQSFCFLLSNSPLLKELLIYRCWGLQTTYLSNVVCTSVRSLGIHGNMRTEIQIALLQMCPAATLYHRHGGENADLSAVPATLEELLVDSCAHVSAVLLNKGLLRLALKDVELDDATLKQIMSNSPLLEVIMVVSNKVLTEESISLIGDKYTETLQLLKLQSMPLLQHTVLEGICTKCKHLHTLEIGGNLQFPPSAAIDVLNWAPNLVKLDLSETRISDAALQRIARSNLGALGMFKTTGYTENGFAALSEGCPAMTHLYVNNPKVNSLVKVMWNMRREKKIIFVHG